MQFLLRCWAPARGQQTAAVVIHTSSAAPNAVSGGVIEYRFTSTPATRQPNPDCETRVEAPAPVPTLERLSQLRCQ